MTSKSMGQKADVPNAAGLAEVLVGEGRFGALQHHVDDVLLEVF